jgi:hypothetical protein
MRWMETASDDLVRDAGGYKNLTVERNKVS